MWLCFCLVQRCGRGAVTVWLCFCLFVCFCGFIYFVYTYIIAPKSPLPIPSVPFPVGSIPPPPPQ